MPPGAFRSDAQAVVNGSADISDRIPFTQVASIEKNPRLRLYVLKGGIAIKIEAGVGERIGCDVYDAHHQRALAQFKEARAHIPLEDRTHIRLILNQLRTYGGTRRKHAGESLPC